MALGGTAGVVTRYVASQGAKVVFVGVVIGVASTPAPPRPLSPLLFDVRLVDPLVFAAMSVTMIGTGMLASWVPTRRARSAPGSRLCGAAEVRSSICRRASSCSSPQRLTERQICNAETEPLLREVAHHARDCAIHRRGFRELVAPQVGRTAETSRIAFCGFTRLILRVRQTSTTVESARRQRERESCGFGALPPLSVGWRQDSSAKVTRIRAI